MMDKTTQKKWINRAQIVLMFLVVIDLYSRFYAMWHPQELPIPKVIVAKPVRQMIAQYMTQTGNVVAYNSVNLVARIEGYLEKNNFVDGTFVKKGANLFIIEPPPYSAKLREANASVAAQKAVQTYDNTEYQRQQRMYKQNATSLNNVQKWYAKSLESEAEVAKAVANQEIAEINYSYTQVKAPFDGRIGRHLVDVGNLVGNGVATVLATIDQLDPIYIYFNLNEIDFLKLRAVAKSHGDDDKVIKHIPVQLSLQNETGYNYEGNLDFVNTGLNASTGTMQFRALIPNKDYALLPGLFVQVRVAISDPTLRLTVPDIAIQYDQIGPYLFLVDKNNEVVLRRITLGGVSHGMRAILQGIKAEDAVIVGGLQNATLGNRVMPYYEHNNSSGASSSKAPQISNPASAPTPSSKQAPQAPSSHSQVEGKTKGVLLEKKAP